MIRPPPTSTLFPYTTLFRSQTTKAKEPTSYLEGALAPHHHYMCREAAKAVWAVRSDHSAEDGPPLRCGRSEEHTSELQSRENLVCRLLLEKKNILCDWRQHI